MKIHLTILTALLLFANLVTAQESVRYGLKAGLNLANYNARVSIIELNTKSIPSFYVTAFADIPIQNSVFSVQPGLSFQGKGAKLSGEFADPTSSQYPAPVIGVTYIERPYWIEVPVNLIGRTEIGGGNQFLLGVGPYLSFGIGGEYSIRTSGSSLMDMFGIGGDIDYGQNGELKSVDFGFNFMAGIELVSGFGIQAGYGLGLTDIGGTKLYVPFEQKNRVFNFGISKTF